MALLLLCAPLLAQTGESAGPATAPLKIKSESRLVLVDVVVTGKKDALVQGLAASDFHVYEDGKEQTVTAFQTHAGPAAPEIPRQHFFLLFDGTSNGDLHSVQEPAAKFIADNAGPNRLMSIAYYESGCMTITTQFTADVVQLQHALGTLPSLFRRCGNVSDPLGDLQARYYAQLARDLAHVPGHKVLALFVASAGPAASPAADMKSVSADNTNRRLIDPAFGSPDPAARASQLSELTPGIAAPSRSAETGRDPFGMEAEFRKADVSVYPVETQIGARTPGWALKLASSTGGRELNRGNDIVAVFNLLAREQDEAYTLGYVPQESPEGSCHALKITVDRPNVRVRGRNLYCNVREVSLPAANPLEAELENTAASPRAGNAAASVPYFYEANGVARVSLAAEIPSPALDPAERNGKLHAEMDVLGMAYNLGDEVAARFSDTLNFDFGSRQEFDDFVRRPLHYERQFKIAPGNYRCKLIFRFAKDRAGVLETPLAVGPFDAHRLFMSAIALGRDVQPISPEAVQEEIEAGKKPLVFRGSRITVSGSDLLLKTGPAEAYLEVYQPPASGGPPVHLSMRLRVLDAQSNEPKWTSGDMDLSALARPGAYSIPVAIKLPVANLAPGAYYAEFTVKDSAGGQVVRSVAFRTE